MTALCWNPAYTDLFAVAFGSCIPSDVYVGSDDNYVGSDGVMLYWMYLYCWMNLLSFQCCRQPVPAERTRSGRHLLLEESLLSGVSSNMLTQERRDSSGRRTLLFLSKISKSLIAPTLHIKVPMLGKKRDHVRRHPPRGLESHYLRADP